MKHAPLRHRLEYGPYLAVKGLLRALPHAASRRFGHGLGALGHRLDTRHRRLALANLALALPELDARRRGQVVRNCYRHFGAAFSEAVSAGRFTPGEVMERFQIEGQEHLHRARETGKGILLITGHFGSWQVAPYALGQIFGGITVVARPPDNPHIARDIDHIRQRCGVTVISKAGAGHKVYSIVRKGGALGMVIDNRVPPKTGIVVPFMGHPARTSSVPAFIGLRTGAPALPTFCYPEAGGRYRLVFAEPIIETGGGDEAVAALTERYLECIATEIRRRPELWLWMHDRWKL